MTAVTKPLQTYPVVGAFIKCQVGWLIVLSVLFPFLVTALRADTSGTDAKRVVVLGDSLAAGYGVEPQEAFPALLQQKVDASGLRFTVVNAGVSGNTSADGLARIDWLLKRKMDVLVLELGGNDGLRGVPVTAMRDNLQAIIERVKQRYPEARILVAGMRLPPNLGLDYTDAFRKVFPELAKKNNATLIPFLLEGVGGKPQLNQDDHIHPTADGHKIVAENVWKVLKPVLEKP